MNLRIAIFKEFSACLMLTATMIAMERERESIKQPVYPQPERSPSLAMIFMEEHQNDLVGPEASGTNLTIEEEPSYWQPSLQSACTEQLIERRQSSSPIPMVPVVSPEFAHIIELTPLGESPVSPTAGLSDSTLVRLLSPQPKESIPQPKESKERFLIRTFRDICAAVSCRDIPKNVGRIKFTRCQLAAAS